VAPLAGLVSPRCTFFVTGNHEYYSGAHAWVSELRRLGLRVLMNEHVQLQHGGASLALVGVGDYSAHHFDDLHRSDPRAAIAGVLDDALVRLQQPFTAGLNRWQGLWVYTSRGTG
jgi:predicted MPP superfamily phosphohydrolase